MNLFQLGDFTLNSGLKRGWKIECDALSYDDIKALVRMAYERGLLPPFSVAIPVPRGGIRIAAALQKYATEGGGLIVEDVWTTGASMEAVRLRRPGCQGFVLFACAPVASWVTPLFTLSNKLDGLVGNWE